MTTTKINTHTGVLCTVGGGIHVVEISVDDYCASIAGQIGATGVEMVAPGRLDDLLFWVGDDSVFKARPNIGTTMFAHSLGFRRDTWLHGDVMITGGSSYDTGAALPMTAEQLASLVGEVSDGGDF